jgi:hypothetical protein
VRVGDFIFLDPANPDASRAVVDAPGAAIASHPGVREESRLQQILVGCPELPRLKSQDRGLL